MELELCTNDLFYEFSYCVKQNDGAEGFWCVVGGFVGLGCHDSESNPQISPAFIDLLNNLTDYNAKKSIYRTGQVTLLHK